MCIRDREWQGGGCGGTCTAFWGTQQGRLAQVAGRTHLLTSNSQLCEGQGVVGGQVMRGGVVDQLHDIREVTGRKQTLAGVKRVAGERVQVVYVLRQCSGAFQQRRAPRIRAAACLNAATAAADAVRVCCMGGCAELSELCSSRVRRLGIALGLGARVAD